MTKIVTGTNELLCDSVQRPLTGRLYHLTKPTVAALPLELALEAQHMVESGRGDEAREAIAAFMQKRKPQFHPDNQNNAGERP